MLSDCANDTLAENRCQGPLLSRFPVAHSRFGERFGYGRWLKHLTDGVAPTHAEIGRAVDRTGPAVGAWLLEAEPPSDWKVHTPLAELLGLEEKWLIRDVGPPPRPELWREWLVARRLDPVRKEAPKEVAATLADERMASRKHDGRTTTARGGGAKKAAGTRGRGRPR